MRSIVSSCFMLWTVFCFAEDSAPKNQTFHKEIEDPQVLRYALMSTYIEDRHTISGKKYDFDTALLLMLAEKVGVQIDIKESAIPWQRTLEMVAVGELDIATQASRTANRAGFAHFSKSYREDALGLIIRSEDANKYNGLTLAKLARSDFRFGAYTGWSYGPLVDGILSIAPHVQRINDLGDHNPDKLAAGRIDGYFGFLPVDLESANSRHNNLFSVYQSELIPAEPLHIMFSKRTVPVSLVEKFNRALEQVKASGELLQLERSYGITFEQISDRMF